MAILKTQQNHCVNLLRKTKQYFKNFNLNDITDNKTSWRTIKNHILTKTDHARTKWPVLTSEKVIANTMNNYFTNIHHKVFKFKVSYSIQCNGHRANNLNFESRKH